jgi:sec-independent protein translocase protein TatB
MFGLSFVKVVIIVIIALFVIGPERLPQFATRLAQLVRTLRRLTDTAKERVREEMGPDFDDVDWQRLDPRQYDPRRIIREALLDDSEEIPVVRRATDASTKPAAEHADLPPVAADAD